MATGELTDALERRCVDAAARATTAAAQQALDRVIRRLHAPLRVAVAGRRGAGKSTLVNAVIGAALAPTDLRECTRLVTSFSQGGNCVHVVGRDGSRQTIGLDADGRVPEVLPRAIDDIDHLEVTVASGALRGLTVIDTPGLATTDLDRAARTQEFLGLEEHAARSSAAAVEGAEAVLYVLGRTARADDREVLAGLRTVTSRIGSSSINTVAVLNQIDRFARRGDPWVAAAQAVQDYRERLAGAIVTVVPMIGVLAQTLVTGQLGHAEITDLRLLADAPGINESTLDNIDDYLEAACDVPTHRRRRIAALLTLYGVSEAVRAIRADAAITNGALHRLLLERSGQPVLADVIDRTLRAQSHALKASWGVAQMEVAARHAPTADRAVLRSAIEEFLADPQAYQLRLLDVAQALDSGTLEMPEQYARDLRMLLAGRTAAAKVGQHEGTDPEVLAELAIEAMNRWASFAVTGASPDQASAAAVVRRAYQLLWRQLTAGAPLLSAHEAGAG